MRNYNIHGFSLIEVLVASILGVLFLTAVLQSYLTAKSIYRSQNDLACLSENIRSAEFVLWQNIMQAGFAGYRKTSELNLTNHSPRPSMILGIRGYDSVRMPGYLLGSNVAEGTDVIVVGKANHKVTHLLGDVVKGATSFKVTKNITTEGNHFLLVSDDKNADLFEAKNWGSMTIYLNQGLNHSYRHINTEVRLFEEKTFFIKDHLEDKKNPRYGLYLSINRGPSQELISDVTDMQIQYIIVNVDGSYRYLRAKNIVNSKQWDKISGVIIDLTIKNQVLLRQRRVYVKLR